MANEPTLADMAKRLEELHSKVDAIKSDHELARKTIDGWAKKAKAVGFLLKKVL